MAGKLVIQQMASLALDNLPVGSPDKIILFSDDDSFCLIDASPIFHTESSTLNDRELAAYYAMIASQVKYRHPYGYAAIARQASLCDRALDSLVFIRHFNDDEVIQLSVNDDGVVSPSELIALDGVDGIFDPAININKHLLDDCDLKHDAEVMQTDPRWVDVSHYSDVRLNKIH